MASYFDIKPRVSTNKSGAGATEGGQNSEEHDDAYSKFGLLSPQVTRILDDLEFDDQSSGSEDAEEDAEEDGSDQGIEGGLDRNQDVSEARQANGDNKSRGNSTAPNQYTTTSSPSSSSKLRKAFPPNEHSDKTPTKAAEKSRSVPKGTKQPHFARFQSLRSMLFSSRIEENIEKCKREEAEEKWKKDFQLRKGLEMPKTPEKDSGVVTPGEKGEGKDGSKERGVMKRMGSKLKRLGSKDVQTMGKLTEGEAVQNKPVQLKKAIESRHDTGNESTASSDDEADGRRESEDINHSDIEDLVRWVSRRDPPSDGEARYRKSDARNPATNSDYADKSDSDQESLGHSDVEDLVRWVIRREATNMRPDAEIQPRAKGEQEGAIGTAYDNKGHTSFSDAETESDSEVGARAGERRGTMNDDDVDELVRWVSRQDRSKAGPVRTSHPNSPTKAVKTLDGGIGLSSPVLENDDEDTAELVRWVKRADDTSGESLDEAPQPKGGEKNQGSRLRDEVLQKADDDQVGKRSLERTGTRDRAESGASLKPEDVDELVRWVSRKHSAT